MPAAAVASSKTTPGASAAGRGRARIAARTRTAAPARGHGNRVFNRVSRGRSGLVELEVVLAKVVRAVAGIDAEELRRVLPHAAWASMGCEEHLALQAVERVAQVQVARAVRGSGGSGRAPGQEVEVVEAVRRVEDERSLHDVPELTHVARPRVGAQARERLRRHRGRGSAEPRGGG